MTFSAIRSYKSCRCHAIHNSWVNFALKLFFCFCLMTPLLAEATTNRFSVIPTFSVQSGDGIVTPGSPTLKKNQWELSQVFHYSYHSIELKAAGVRVSGVVDHLLVQQLGVGYGLTDRLTLEGFLPIVWWNRFTPTTIGSTPTNKTNAGDINLQARYQFLDRNKDPFGLAFAPFITLPTGSNSSFTGESRTTGGFRLVADKKLGRHVSIGLNTGVKFQEKVILQDLNTSSQFMLGATAAVDITHGLTGKAEIASATTIDDFYKKKISSPTELHLGLNQSFKKTGINVGVGTSLSVVRAAGTPLFRTFTSFTYSPKIGKRKTIAKGREPIVIYFASNSSSLSLESKARLDQETSRIKTHTSGELIIVTGYADSKGSEAYNRRLSLRRAQAVQKYLEHHGIRDLKINGMGKVDSANRAQNRRVEIKFN